MPYSSNRIKDIIREALNHYSAQCNCCYETRYEFLTFDHVNNDGYLQKGNWQLRKGRLHVSRWLIENNFPEGWQVLCFNCNAGRQYARLPNNICPHKFDGSVFTVLSSLPQFKFGKKTIVHGINGKIMKSESWMESDSGRSKCASCHGWTGSNVYNCPNVGHVNFVKHARLVQRIKHLQCKITVLSHYSPSLMCGCCNESNPFFLTLEHINNNGADEREKIMGNRKIAGYRFMLKMIRLNYPSGYGVTCYNCNSGREWAHLSNKQCPHKTEVMM